MRSLYSSGFFCVVGANPSRQVVNALLARERSRGKLLVQEAATGVALIHLRAGGHDRGRSVGIAALGRRNTVCQRHVRAASACVCNHHITEVDVAGCRKPRKPLPGSLRGLRLFRYFQ